MPKGSDLSDMLDPEQDQEPEWKAPPRPEGCPPPGIYQNIAREEYDAWRAVTRGVLLDTHFVSPKHGKAHYEGCLPHRDGPLLRFGSATHLRLLEPVRFKTQVLVAQPCPEPIQSAQSKRKGQPCGNTGTHRDPESGLWYCGQHRKAYPAAVVPDEVVTIDEANRIERLRTELFAHPIVDLFRRQGGSEVSLLADIDGIPCKGRIDKLIRNCPIIVKQPSGEEKRIAVNVIIDVKTITPGEGTPHALSRTIKKYRLDFQLTWYRHLFRVLTGEDAWAAWIFVERDEPYDIVPRWALYPEADIDWIRLAEPLIDAAWSKWKYSVQHNWWPGCGADIEPLPVPDHIRRSREWELSNV